MNIRSNMEWAFSQHGFSREWKLVLVILAFYADSNGRGRISLVQIAHDGSFGQRPEIGVREIMEGLELCNAIYISFDEPAGLVSYRLRLPERGHSS